MDARGQVMRWGEGGGGWKFVSNRWYVSGRYIIDGIRTSDYELLAAYCN